MLKKDLYANAYILTVLAVAGAIGYYVFVFQKRVVGSFNQDPKRVEVSVNQSRLGQQMVKNAIGMGYSKSERNFNIFRGELKRIYPEWQKGHKALLEGDEDLGISQPRFSGDYLKRQETLRFSYIEINSNVLNLLDVVYTENKTDVSALSLRKSIEVLINASRSYQKATSGITEYFVSNAQSRDTSISLSEYIGYAIFIGVFLLQGVFIFRPLVKLASDNYLSANKAFIKVQESEKRLRVNFQKQRFISKKLYLSRKVLEKNNKRLKESEEKLLKSSEEQIKINEKLISAQDKLRLSNQKLQDSEKEVRELADQQLQDNEKLFLAEKKLQTTLKKEKQSKDELSRALQTLKGAQSQLVHSEKMASLGQLTAGIAHEINNPINFISSGMVSLKMSIESLRTIAEEYGRIEKGENPKKVIKNVQELKEEHEYEEMIEELDGLIGDVNYGVQRTIEIVKGLRVFSRLDEEEAKNANINENIDATLILLRNKTKDRIKITRHYDKTMKDIECFPGQLNQVFMNILNNAVQAMPENKKGAEITIYTEETKKDVRIRIKDNGVGIPEEIKDRIWEPFFTTKEVGVGTGLGMSITYGIIEKHGGDIELTSEVGKGAEFAITLPKKIKFLKQEGQKVVMERN